MSERFYVNCELVPGPVVLEGSEAHHLATVCRLRPGAAVCLFNGDGREYSARVVAVERRRVDLEVTESTFPPRELPFQLILAAPLPRGDRAQMLVEKLTELGVARFIPLETTRSVVKPREAKLERLQRHVIEASKQCGRNVLMDIEPMAAWAELCRRPELPTRRILAHPGGSAWTSCLTPPADVVLAVGPEGGFSDEEVSAAVAVGWRPVGLGPRILRVETAALALAVLAGCVPAREGHKPPVEGPEG
jgi:16S rRNA (uracil1498-N3)-methyltransferase